MKHLLAILLLATHCNAEEHIDGSSLFSVTTIVSGPNNMYGHDGGHTWYICQNRESSPQKYAIVTNISDTPITIFDYGPKTVEVFYMPKDSKKRIRITAPRTKFDSIDEVYITGRGGSYSAIYTTLNPNESILYAFDVFYPDAAYALDIESKDYGDLEGSTRIEFNLTTMESKEKKIYHLKSPWRKNSRIYFRK